MKMKTKKEEEKTNMKTLFLSLLSLTLAFNAKAAKTTDMVVATVNNQAITLQELKDRITLSKLLINKNLNSMEFDVLKKQAIDQLVKEELVRQYTDNKKISVSGKQLQGAVAFIEKQRKLEPGKLMENIPDDLRYSAVTQIKNSILEKKIVEKVIVRKVFIPEYQIQTLLENVLSQAISKEYTISQILINHTNNPQVDARKVSKIYEQLVQGEKFEDLVIAYSDGPNKLEGGKLGKFSLNELNNKLQRTVKKLATGEFSKPVKGQNGWFIVKVNNIKVTENLDTTETEEFKYVTFLNKKISKQKLKEIVTLAENVNGYTDYKNFEKTLKNDYKFSVLTQAEWVNVDNIDKPLIKLLTKTLPGNFSKIYLNKDHSSQFIYMQDKQVRQSAQVQKIKKRIERNLQAQQAERKFKQLMKELKAKAFIELR